MQRLSGSMAGAAGRMVLAAFFVSWLALAAPGDIQHSTLSPYFETLEQSLDGVTLRLTMPQEPGAEKDRQRGLLAIPAGPMPAMQLLEFSCVTWSQGNIVSASGPFRVTEATEVLSAITRPDTLVNLTPLGLMREVRLAAVQVSPYHSGRGPAGGLMHQIYHLTFRVRFAPGARPASPEPDFSKPYPSGYRSLFQQVLLNSQAIPQGGEAGSDGDATGATLPYFDAPSLVLGCTQEGLHFLAVKDVTPISEAPITPEQLALFHQRREVPLAILRSGPQGYSLDDQPSKPLKADDGLLFFAPRSNSPYSPEAVFFLTLTGGKKRIRTKDEVQSTLSPNEGEQLDIAPATSARMQYRVEENRALWKKQNKAKDKTQHQYWIWQEVDGQHPFECRLELPGPLDVSSPTGVVQIKLRVLPETLTSVSPLSGYEVHVAEATYDGAELKHERVGGDSSAVQVLVALPVASLDPAQPAFAFAIEPASATGANATAFALDRLDLEYERALQVDLKGAEFTPRIGDRTWALARPQSVTPEAYLAIARNATGELFSLPVKTEKDTVLVQSPRFLEDHPLETISVLPASRPTALRPVAKESSPRRLDPPGSGADLIVITHPSLFESVRPLADVRQAQGYRVRMIPTEDIYKYFGDGSLNPETIRHFLRFAYEHWSAPRPTYVLLVGEARWDYWDHLGVGVPNLVPSYHPVPAYASDNWYACVSGEDPLPEYFIGRISVADATAAQNAIGKIIEYEQQAPPGPWRGRILFVSDNEKVFEDETNLQIANKVPVDLLSTHLRVRDYPFVDDYFKAEDAWLEQRTKYSEACNQAVLDHLHQGYLLWEYYGHGAPNVFAEERIFFGGGSIYSDVKRMKNRPYLPVLLGLTCDTIQFDYAGEVGPQWTLCMGEELLNYPHGGAIAVFGATGRGYTTHHVMLNNGFHDALFLHGFRTLGELVTAAKLFTFAVQQEDEPLEMFGLLGDPLTRLPLPEPAVVISVKPTTILQGKGGTLSFEMDLTRLPSRQLSSLRVLTLVRDSRQQVLHQQERHRLSRRPIRYEVEVPPDSAVGTGTIHAFVYSPDSTQTYTGGARFSILPRTVPGGYPAGALPDLVLSATGIRSLPESPRSGETIFFDVDVANPGEAPAQSVEVAAYDGPPDSGGRLLEDRSYWEGPRLPLLLPGETQTIRLRWDPVLNAGPHTLFFRADPGGQIEEMNETNNDATVALYVRKKIDLTIVQEDVRVSPLGGATTYSLRMGIRNIGETVSEGCPVHIYVYATEQEGDPVEHFIIEEIPAIPPEKRLWVSLDQPLPANAVRLEIVVDPDDIRDEETHKNNRISLLLKELLAQENPAP